MTKAQCCSKCFERIAKHNTRCARLWLDLCQVSDKVDGVFGVENLDTPELRFLEIKGFITTTDEPLYTIIKVHTRSTNKKIFCMKPEDHED